VVIRVEIVGNDAGQRPTATTVRVEIQDDSSVPLAATTEGQGGDPWFGLSEADLITMIGRR